VRWWKVLGVAAFVGVAAGGVLIARDERRRLAYTPDEIRQRLHERLEEASAAAVPFDDAQAGQRGDPGR